MTLILPRLIALTFDIDLVDYVTGHPLVDELAIVPAMLDILDARQRRATWFIRIDEHTRATFGEGDFVFREYSWLVNRLLARGDEIGWHVHSYRQSDGDWKPNADPAGVAAEIHAYALQARARGLRTVRMGWGFHTNDTMRAIVEAGFAVDSSAIPRPRYPWDDPPKDWTITPAVPYRPSIADYRTGGEPDLPIVEVPMSLAAIPAATDTMRVMRYLNPAFECAVYARALENWFAGHDVLVTISHPHELMPSGAGHPLLTRSMTDFACNLDAIGRAAAMSGQPVEFVTVSELASRSTMVGDAVPSGR